MFEHDNRRDHARWPRPCVDPRRPTQLPAAFDPATQTLYFFTKFTSAAGKLSKLELGGFDGEPYTRIGPSWSIQGVTPQNTGGIPPQIPIIHVF